MDVVPDAGSVLGRVVVAEDLHPAPGGHAGQYGRDQVGFRAVPFAEPGAVTRLVCARHVEVAQADRAEPVQPGELGERGVHGELRRPVRVGGAARIGFGDGRAFRLAVDGCGGGEHDGADPDLAHRLEQRDRAAQVGRPVLGRLRHRLADQRLRREVQDRLGAVGQDLGGAVTHRALDERGPGRHRVGVPGGQVVEHRDLVSGRDELRGHHASDVPGAAGDEHFHEVAFLCPACRSRCAACSGTTSLIHTPIPDSVPARYFSLSAARRTRQYLKAGGELAARRLIPDRLLVPRGDFQIACVPTGLIRYPV